MMNKFLKITVSVIGVAFLCLMICGQVAKTAMKPTLEERSQKTEFAKAIERANSDCPIPVAMGNGNVTGIKLEERYVTYYLSYSPEFTNILTQFHNDEKVKEGMLMCFLCVNGQGKNQGDVIMDALVRFGYGLRVVINESGNGHFDFRATADDIKSLREKYQLNPHEALYNFLSLSIEAERINLPKELGEGMVVIDYKLEGDGIAIVVLIDENIYPIDELKANTELIKNSIIEGALSQPESHSLLDMCKISHTGLIYRLLGKQSHRNIDIEIPCEEIRRIVDTPSNVNVQ